MSFELNYEFSDLQSVAMSSGSTTKSTNIDTNARSNYDAWGTAKAIEIGDSCCVVTVTTKVVGGACIPKLVTKAANASISSGGTVVATLPTIAASSVAGVSVSVILPPGTTRLKYIGMLYTASGGKITAGNVNAQLRPYPSQVID